ncbi:hypothetical protein FISHEDRAFT_57738 [Fistulina hepatica ATCC 64428]|uniref:Uncharacterized protein n=1 Tax=Fistulina hepatica ATCC 64428 TaxID=1128425 RepID=A0A0D7AF90_9AGAR|nr:hypothetical protein FISHEDRAFT_57738 [Fistulina hepatica ATCC 64428]
MTLSTLSPVHVSSEVSSDQSAAATAERILQSPTVLPRVDRHTQMVRMVNLHDHFPAEIVVAILQGGTHTRLSFLVLDFEVKIASHIDCFSFNSCWLRLKEVHYRLRQVCAEATLHRMLLTKIYESVDNNPSSAPDGERITPLWGYAHDYSIAKMVWDLELESVYLSSLVHIQAMDAFAYPDLDLSDFNATLVYICDMCVLLQTAIEGLDPEEDAPAVELLKEALNHFFMEDVRTLPDQAGERAQALTRSLCEDVHRELAEHRGHSPSETAPVIMGRVQEGLSDLLDLIKDTYNDDSRILHLRQITDRLSSKDRPSKSEREDYESIE